jgi:hypothetical protein
VLVEEMSLQHYLPEYFVINANNRNEPNTIF